MNIQWEIPCKFSLLVDLGENYIGVMIGKFITMHACQVLYILTLDATIVEKLSEMSMPSH